MPFAIPKSMSLRVPETIKKLAGFRSECTIRSLWIVLTASSICCQYSLQPEQSAVSRHFTVWQAVIGSYLM